jgi:hypothetical protein
LCVLAFADELGAFVECVPLLLEFFCAGFFAEVVVWPETPDTVSAPAATTPRTIRLNFLLLSGLPIVTKPLGYLLSAGTGSARNTVMTRSVLLRRSTLNTTFSPAFRLLTALR